MPTIFTERSRMSPRSTPFRAERADMSRQDSGRALARRSFLSRLGVGLATGGAAAGMATPALQAQSAGAWQPARPDLDSWYDQVPGSHRFVVDTFTPDGFGNALAFLNNFYNTNG